MTSELPDFDPHRLDRQLALIDELRHRNLITEEEYNERYDRVRNEHDERHAQYVAAAYQLYDIPQMEQEFDEAMTRAKRKQLSRSRRWLYSWNLEPEEDLFDLVTFWNNGPEKVREKDRQLAEPRVASSDDFVAHELDWLWPGRLPLGKISLLTGDASEGKSLIACDLIARVTTGRDWPDGAENPAPGEVLLIAPEGGLNDVVFPRLNAAEAGLSRLHVLSSVGWQDRKTGDPDSDSFRLPLDGLKLERILEQHDGLRLVVIDPLSEFLTLPNGAAERESALHDVLADLEALAEYHQLALVCVETARQGGLIRPASGRQWRAHYDPAFQTVWGVARDPRDRRQRLFLPVRHHLGDDRTGFQFTIEPAPPAAARIEWGRADDSITYPEASGRVRLGRGIWSFSQTADAEVWLRDYLKTGEKPSVEIFCVARELGFTEHPVRDALRRVASKSKQGNDGPWYWALKTSG